MTLPRSDAKSTTQALMVVLYQAALLARLMTSKTRGRAPGLDALQTSKVHELMEAVHNIPRAITEVEFAADGCPQVVSSVVSQAFERYDASWGPSSAHRAQVGSPFECLSLVATYRSALARAEQHFARGDVIAANGGTKDVRVP